MVSGEDFWHEKRLRLPFVGPGGPGIFHYVREGRERSAGFIYIFLIPGANEK